MLAHQETEWLEDADYKMKPIIITIFAILLLGSLIVFGFFKTGNVIKEDVFEGIITNLKLEPGFLEGTGVYDRTCKMIENGLSQCDAGIQTEKGLLNFNYKHNMNIQGCIDSGQKLKVEILDSNGKARVTRY